MIETSLGCARRHCSAIFRAKAGLAFTAVETISSAASGQALTPSRAISIKTVSLASSCKATREDFSGEFLAKARLELFFGQSSICSPVRLATSLPPASCAKITLPEILVSVVVAPFPEARLI